MKATSEEQILQYRYLSIQVTGFQISEPEWGDRVPDDITFGFRWVPTFDPDKEQVAIECAVVGYLGEKETLVFELITRHLFEVRDLLQFSPEPGKIRPPHEMLLTFLSLGYSACRGILFERLGRSSLAGVLMPVIDPKEIYENALVRPDAQSSAGEMSSTKSPSVKKSSATKKRAPRRSR